MIPNSRPDQRTPNLAPTLKDSAITEDDERKGLKSVQETTDKAVGKVDEITGKAPPK